MAIDDSKFLASWQKVEGYLKCLDESENEAIRKEISEIRTETVILRCERILMEGELEENSCRKVALCNFLKTIINKNNIRNCLLYSGDAVLVIYLKIWI